MTICSLTFFLFANVSKVRQWHLRFIALCILVSWIYDFIWMLLNTTNYWRSQKYDGDVELGLRRFVILISFVAIIFKVLHFMIFWKVSVEFNRFFNEDLIADGYGLNQSSKQGFERDHTPPKRVMMMDPYQP
mmetsp:Transcript_10409/g.9188  ORF Transcript_10409/g.9188 Transcript_10409/m.9188 type:complete len:132 (+) Transcript_10409:318-713(+)